MTHTGNRNDMSTWPEITCQRGHQTHKSRRVIVQLDGPTPYSDFAPIPHKFARDFVIDIYPPELYLVDGGPYCPAHDAVSETIASHGVWEPRETVLALTVCESAARAARVIDIGAQIGWFTLLALSASTELEVLAVDADEENLRLLRASADANGWTDRVLGVKARIGQDHNTPRVFPAETPIRLVKIDIEGAEDAAIDWLWPHIEAGNVDHIMMEVSPVFAGYYPDLIAQLVAVGYRAYVLPPKQSPPVTLENPSVDMEPYRIDSRPDMRALIASWHQEDVWLVREGAEW